MTHNAARKTVGLVRMIFFTKGSLLSVSLSLLSCLSFCPVVSGRPPLVAVGNEVVQVTTKPVLVAQTSVANEYVYFPMTLHSFPTGPSSFSLLLGYQTIADASHPTGWTGRTLISNDTGVSWQDIQHDASRKNRHFNNCNNRSNSSCSSNDNNDNNIQATIPLAQRIIKPCILAPNASSAICMQYDTRIDPSNSTRAWLGATKLRIGGDAPGLHISGTTNITFNFGPSKHTPEPWSNLTYLMVTDGGPIVRRNDGGLLLALYGEYAAAAAAATTTIATATATTIQSYSRRRGNNSGSSTSNSLSTSVPPGVIAVMHSSDDGHTWTWLATAAGPGVGGMSECGTPSENHAVRLGNGSIYMVFRSGGKDLPLCSTVSHDEGMSWSPAIVLPAAAATATATYSNITTNQRTVTTSRTSSTVSKETSLPHAYVWGVEPKIVRVGTGSTSVLVLSTGRPGLMLWTSPDPPGPKGWTPFNIALAHNALVPAPWRYNSGSSGGGYPTQEETTSYTGLIVLPSSHNIGSGGSTDGTGSDSADTFDLLISYDCLRNGWHPAPVADPSRIFVMRLRINITSAFGERAPTNDTITT